MGLDVLSKCLVTWGKLAEFVELRNYLKYRGYASKRYRDMLRRADMQQSMSRAGDCYDNAFMESCFGTIKMELEMTEYEDKQTALKQIRAFIAYYNTQRKHSSIGYLTPCQFEAI